MAQAIVGSWYIGHIEDLGSTDQLAVTFLEDGTFLVADKGTADAFGRSGLEYGTYTWNATTGALVMNYTVNTDGEWGTSNAGLTTATVVGDNLTFFGSDTPPEGFVIPRLISAANSIVGSWFIGDPDGDHGSDKLVFTFLADGTYMLADKGTVANDPSGTSGIEQGTYTWNLSTGAFAFNTLVNTDGEWGLSHTNGEIQEIHLVGDTLFIGPLSENFGLTRLSPLPAGQNATSGPDVLTGTASNDAFNGLGGNDTIDGLGAIDTSVYTGLRGGHTISTTLTGFTVTDNSGPDGNDTLSNVERLQFSDVRVALDVSGNAGTVAKVLGAVFGADSIEDHPDYVGIGLALVDGGMSYATLMQLAIEVRLGAGASNAAVVELLYTNVIGIAPGAEALALYVGLLDSGTFTAGTLGVLAADTPMNQANIDLVGLAQTGIIYT